MSIKQPTLAKKTRAKKTAKKSPKKVVKKVAAKRDPGRPTTFKQSIADKICEGIACGEPLKAIVREKGMPAERTVYRWLKAEDGFRQQYAHAREDQGDADADAVVDIAKQVLKGRVPHQAGRVAIDALKWSAGKRKPKVYGERVDLNHGGQADNPLALLLRQVNGNALPTVADDPEVEP